MQPADLAGGLHRPQRLLQLIQLQPLQMHSAISAAEIAVSAAEIRRRALDRICETVAADRLGQGASARVQLPLDLPPDAQRPVVGRLHPPAERAAALAPGAAPLAITPSAPARHRRRMEGVITSGLGRRMEGGARVRRHAPRRPAARARALLDMLHMLGSAGGRSSAGVRVAARQVGRSPPLARRSRGRCLVGRRRLRLRRLRHAEGGGQHEGGHAACGSTRRRRHSRGLGGGRGVPF